MLNMRTSSRKACSAGRVVEEQPHQLGVGEATDSESRSRPPFIGPSTSPERGTVKTCHLSRFTSARAHTTSAARTVSKRIHGVCVTALAVGVLVLSGAGPAAADSGYCRPTMILGIPGSGQGEQWDVNQPYGPEVKAAVEAAVAAGGGYNLIHATPLNYPARLHPFHNPKGSTDRYTYTASKNAGYRNAYGKLAEWARNCRATQPKFVLIGYSQGAHIAGDLTATILRGQAPALAGRLIGSLLLADPALKSDDPKNLWINGPRKGNGGFTGNLPRASWMPSDPVYSVCIAADQICDYQLGNPVSEGIKIHAKYADESYSWSQPMGLSPPTSEETIAEYFGKLIATDRFPPPTGLGTALAWGFGASGQIGNGETANRPSPTGIEGVGTVIQLAAGMNVAYALDEGGRVWAWGDNNGGQLGRHPGGSSSIPALVPGLPSPIRSIGATGYGGYAVDFAGEVWAWGQDGQGQLGGGSLGSGGGNAIPMKVAGLTGVVETAGALYTGYALTEAGDVYSWGANFSGQLGRGEGPSTGSAARVAGLPAMASIASGGEVAIGTAKDGTVWVWGGCTGCFLGNGQQFSYVPVQVPGLNGATSAAASRSQGYDNLYVVSGGSVWAWGAIPTGVLGEGTETPEQIVGLTDINQIAAGDGSLYALAESGDLYALGFNDFGQLGDGTTVTRTTPGLVGVSGSVLGIAAASWTAYLTTSAG